MRTLIIILVSILTLGVVGTGGYFAYQYGISAGENEGYETGYATGQETGYEVGTEEGYAKGYADGEGAGYETGYDNGSEVGYETGYDEGEATGYKTGFLEGNATGVETGYDTGYSAGVEDGIGHGYTLKDPTYAEALSFMRSDKTDENEYLGDDYGIYVCSHFSRDTGNNAEDAGYRCAFVELRHSDVGHTIIAFNTVDRGLVYFEPQSDEIVEPVVGKRYYQCIVAAPGVVYEEPSYDDTILDILLIW